MHSFHAWSTVTSMRPKISLTLLIHLLHDLHSSQTNWFTHMHSLYNLTLNHFFLCGHTILLRSHLIYHFTLLQNRPTSNSFILYSIAFLISLIALKLSICTTFILDIFLSFHSIVLFLYVKVKINILLVTHSHNSDSVLLHSLKFIILFLHPITSIPSSTIHTGYLNSAPALFNPLRFLYDILFYSHTQTPWAHSAVFT